MLSDDGLELYFWRGSLNPPFGDVFTATRNSVIQAFGTPVPVNAVNTNENENGVLLAHSGLELFVFRANEIMRYTRTTAATTWGTPTAIGMSASFISLSADDLVMYLIQACQVGHHNADGPCLFRSTRSAIGAAWSQPQFEEWPGGGVLQWYGAHVSSDELRILVSNPYSGSAIRAAEASRTHVGDVWGPLRVVDSLSLETTNEYLRWTSQEDAIYLSARPVTPAVGGYDIYVSVLQ
jgi:hypothetical protein